MASKALAQRLTRIFDKADAVYKREEIEARINELASLYDREGRLERESRDSRTVHVNKVYPRVNTAMSSLYAKNPEIICRPRRAEDEPASAASEVLLNYLTHVLVLSRELREWLFWSRLTMYGVMKLAMTNWRGFKVPTFIVHDPRSVRVDVSSDRFRPDEAQCQMFRYRRSLAQLRASGLYADKQLNKLADSVSDIKGDDFSEETTDIWLWENYIREYVEGKETILVATVAHGHDDKTFNPEGRVWIREEQYTDAIGLPGRFLWFAPSPKTWYPFSPIEAWIPQQKEISGFRTQKSIAAERSNPKIIVQESAFSPDELEKLQSPEYRAYVMSNVAPKDAMMPEPIPNVSPDIYNGEIEADNTITEIDGIGSAQLGNNSGPAQGSNSATRDAIIENALRLRMTGNQEVWNEALEGAYQGLLALAQEGMEGDLRLKLLGPMDMTINRASIKGEIGVIMGFGSTQPRDRNAEWSEAKEMFAMAYGKPEIDQARVWRYVFSKKGDIKDADQWLKTLPPPPPMMPPPGPGPMGPQVPQEPNAMDMNRLAVQNIQAGASPLQMAAGQRGLHD